MNSTRRIRRNKERGIAMLVALLTLVLLAIIGMGFMFMSNSENAVNSNYKDSQKAYFASRAGLEDVRVLLTQGTNLYNQATGLQMPQVAGGGPGIIYVFNSNDPTVIPDPTSGPNGALTSVAQNPTLDDELCHEQFALLVSTKSLTNTADPAAPCGSGASSEVMSGAPPQNYFHTPNPVLAAGSLPYTGTAGALPFKWVRITNKQNQMGLLNNQLVTNGQPGGAQVCWTGKSELAWPLGCADYSANNPSTPVTPVWTLTSLAVTPSGSRRMTQMEVAYTPPLYPPGTITTEAPVTLVGSYSINSYDNCSCLCTSSGGNNPVTTCTTKPGQTKCYDGAHVIYTGGTITVNGSSGQVISKYGTDAPSASVQNVNPWPYDTNALIDQYKQAADNATTTSPWNYSCSGTPNFTTTPAQYANCGTQTSQVFGTFPPNMVQSKGSDNSGAVPAAVYVPGSLKLTSDANGAGILIVDGDLEINGGLNYYGLLLVRGKVSFTGGGSQAVNLYGGILAGEDVSATDQALTDQFGGSINFKYDRCALSLTAPPGPPKMLATHEVMF